MDKTLIIQDNILERLDKYLTKELSLNRNQIQKYIKQGYILVNNKLVKPNLKLKKDDIIDIKIKNNFIKKDFFVDILYEDDDILVINKPIDVVVHRANSVNETTLVDYFKAQNKNLYGEVNREGIVHRLDKTTSGVMVLAKTKLAYNSLVNQLKNREINRYYIAIINKPLKENIIIDKPIGKDKSYVKMIVRDDGKSAKSAFIKLLENKNSNIELISAKLFSGRTHQIRVHLKYINRIILGDTLYGFKSKFDNINRVFLHSYIMQLIHPKTGKKMEFVAKIDKKFIDFFDKGKFYEQTNKDFIINSFNDFLGL